MQKDIYKLTAKLFERPWGGNFLANLKCPNFQQIGESWEVSTHNLGSSELNGVALSMYLQLNYLVKFIDTNSNLSVQVHPGDEYARLHENDSGKTECWLILRAQKDSGIYLGCKPGVTKDIFRRAIEENRVVEYLNFIRVEEGDFIEVPFGTLHAIGGNITLVEVQQSSGITYRVWDWNRVDENGKSRELHINKALDVINFESAPKILKASKTWLKEGIFKLMQHEDFQVRLVVQELTENLLLSLKRGESIIVLAGEVEIDGEQIENYNSCIIMNDREYHLKIKTDARFLIVSPVGEV